MVTHVVEEILFNKKVCCSSPLRIYGINHTLRACAPLESLRREPGSYKRKIPKCLPECELVDYTTNIRVNRLDPSFGIQTNDTASLVLYYDTFAYDTITEYHENLFDFLCKSISLTKV